MPRIADASLHPLMVVTYFAHFTPYVVRTTPMTMTLPTVAVVIIPIVIGITVIAVVIAGITIKAVIWISIIAIAGIAIIAIAGIAIIAIAKPEAEVDLRLSRGGGHNSGSQNKGGRSCSRKY